MTQSTIHIQRASFETRREQEDFWLLLNSYATDIMGGGELLNPANKEPLFAQLKTRPGVFVFIAYAGDEPVGLMNCFEGFSTFRAGPLLNIHDFVVVPAFRSKGIAHLLLQEAEKVAIGNNYCKLTLEVLEGNSRALKVYKDFGFEGYELDPAMGKALFLEKKIC